MECNNLTYSQLVCWDVSSCQIEILLKSYHAFLIWTGAGPEHEVTSARWSRPLLPHIDPRCDDIEFQQLDVDYYVGMEQKQHEQERAFDVKYACALCVRKQADMCIFVCLCILKCHLILFSKTKVVHCQECWEQCRAQFQQSVCMALQWRATALWFISMDLHLTSLCQPNQDSRKNIVNNLRYPHTFIQVVLFIDIMYSIPNWLHVCACMWTCIQMHMCVLCAFELYQFYFFQYLGKMMSQFK